MSRLRGMLAVALLLAATPVVSAQMVGATGVARMSPAVAMIPADATGYLVINDLESSLSTVDRFLKEIGVGDQFPAPLMQMLKSSAKLGDGFKPRRGVAVAMLNLKKHGYDLAKMIEEEQEPDETPPFVAYLPGSSVKGILPNATTARQGKYLKVTMPDSDEPAYAYETKEFVLLAPTTACLDDATSVRNPAGAQLTVKQTALAGRSLAFAHVNMDVVGPIYIKMMQQAMKEMESDAGHMGPSEKMVLGLIKPVMTGYMDVLETVIDEMEGLDMALRISDKNVLFEELILYRKGGLLSKSAPKENKDAQSLLSALPAEKWVLAMGQIQSPGPGARRGIQIVTDMLRRLEKQDLPIQLPANTPGRIGDMLQTYSEQTQSIQLALGGAAQGNGLFGMTHVLNVKNPAKIEAVLTAKAKWLQDLIKANAEQAGPAGQLQISYKNNVETVGGTQVNALVIDHPMLAQLPPAAKNRIKMMLGEDKVRFFVARAGNNRIVSSFGGGLEGISEALSAARANSGKIAMSEGVPGILADMPGKLSGIMLLNPAHALSLVSEGMQKVSPFAPGIPFQMQTKKPIAVGAASTDTDAHVVYAVPTDLVADFVRIGKMYQQMQERRMREQMRRWDEGADGPDDEDF